LRLAGWPDDRAVWTGSCPCQPFSAAGKRGGTDDARHLWPEFYRLIAECRPATVFGEQVASKDGLAWLDIVSTDLEGADYAVGAADLCAAGVGAPHIRQRLYFVGHASSAGTGRHAGSVFAAQAQRSGERIGDGNFLLPRKPASSTRVVADAGRHLGARNQVTQQGARQHLGNSDDEGSQRRRIRWNGPGERTTWSADLVSCRDGKWRPVEPGTFPLAHRVPHRVGLLRGYGNAIVPQVAATFIEAYLDGCRE
jgi:DNA (cytosine-5)-methyltransferase 1